MPDKNGWFKIHRKFIESDIWLSEKFTKGQAWVDLIGFANHKDKSVWIRGVEVKVKRGQSCRSILTLAERWQWSRNKVKRFLKWLKTNHQINHQKTNVTSVITIVNYNKWQIGEPPNEPPNEPPKGHQKDTKRTTNKNEKNEKEIYTTSFLSFWQKYPKKTGKGGAFKSYQNIKSPKPTLEQILKSLNEHQKSDQWQTKQFIPNPSTWLNQRRWEDEIETQPDRPDYWKAM